jgi:hypothetical protein
MAVNLRAVFLPVVRMRDLLAVWLVSEQVVGCIEKG